jgi:phosphatidylglycerophosphate synthase
VIARPVPTAPLVLIVPAASAGEPPAPDTAVVGLPILRRIALAARRAGLVPVVASGLCGPGLLDGTGALGIDAVMQGAEPGRRRIIVCPANVIPQARWLAALADTILGPETIHVDSSLVAVIDTEDPGKVLAETQRSRGADELLAALGEHLPRAASALGDARSRFALRAVGDLDAAERWLLQGLVKDSEGFMSRHFERKISLAITRRLAPTGVTPNAMTLVSLAVGLASAPFFLSAHPAVQVAAAFIFLAHSILDGCDGELARLKFLESRHGAMLDFWGDNAVHVAVFGCMAGGWSLATDSGLPLLLGFAAIGAVGVATAVLSGTGLQPKPPGLESAGARVVDALANRDFIYLVIALSFVGRAWWFVALVAVGTPIFVLAALLTSRHRPAS